MTDWDWNFNLGLKLNFQPLFGLKFKNGKIRIEIFNLISIWIEIRIEILFLNPDWKFSIRIEILGLKFSILMKLGLKIFNPDWKIGLKFSILINFSNPNWFFSIHITIVIIMQEEVINSFLSVKTYLKLIYSFKNIKNGENWAYFEVKKPKGRVVLYIQLNFFTRRL